MSRTKRVSANFNLCDAVKTAAEWLSRTDRWLRVLFICADTRDNTRLEWLIIDSSIGLDLGKPELRKDWMVDVQEEACNSTAI
jgi:hypothetical protein